MSDQKRSFWLSPQRLAALGFIGAASYFLLIEYRQHLFAWLPFLILALCPLMHIFMRSGHNHDRHHQRYSEDNENDSNQDAHQRGMGHGK